MESDKSPLLKLIDKVSFFNDFLESEKRELIDKKVLVKKYEKEGSAIFREGDKGGSVVVVLSGEVSVVKSTVPATDKGKISLISPKRYYHRKIRSRISYR
jgi:CRP-like cAMP-binding protein